jgi:peroxiredoxin
MNRPIFRTILLPVLLAVAGSLAAADTMTILKGRNPGYAGDTLVFLSYSNMVSFTEREVGRCAVSDSGLFECSIPLAETRHIFAHLGVYNCYLYAEPGMVYNLQLPRKREKSLQELMNPFFEETAVHLNVKIEQNLRSLPLPPLDQELNFMIRAFNDSFYPYYYKFVIEAYGNQVDRKELNKAEKEIISAFDSLPGTYLHAYINYRMGLLEHFGGQESSQKIIQDYFLGRPVLLQNPAYMELFNQVFKDYFLAFSEEHPNLRFPLVVNRDMDYSAANSILKKEASLVNDTLRELVLLKGLYDGFYDGKNIPSSMIQLLDSLKNNSSIRYCRQAVQDIMHEITKLLPGYQPPDFALYDSDSTLVHLSDFRGDYVYLNFCNSFGYYCVREYEYLRILYERLQGSIRIVTILVDDSFNDMKQLVESNNYPWIFLHFSNQPQVLEDYDIRSYPSYFLIGPEGKLILSPAPSPVENFESTFRKISSGQ